MVKENINKIEKADSQVVDLLTELDKQGELDKC